jgi:hypothetical protein
MENDLQARNARARDYLISVQYRRIVRRDEIIEAVYPFLMSAFAVSLAWAVYTIITKTF